MNEIINQLTFFLNESPKNALTITQGEKRLSKATIPKYLFFKKDIEDIFGSVEKLLTCLPSKGFSDGTKVILKKTYGENLSISAAAKIYKTFTLNFPAQRPIVENTAPEPSQNMIQPDTSLALPTAQAPMPAQSFLPPAPTMLGYAQVPQAEWISSQVVRERFDDLKKENTRLENDLQDSKSEIRQLKDENFSLKLKLETAEEKFNVKLERELLNKKGFFESETGGKIVDALGAVLPTIAHNMMNAPTAALASPDLSDVKRQFIAIIGAPEVSDEQVTQLYQMLIGNENNEN